MRLASTSSMNSSRTGSNRSLRRNSQAIAAAWQAICDLRATSALAAGWARDLTQSKKLRTWLVGIVPGSRGGGNSSRRASLDTSVLPESPVSIHPSSPSKRTGQVPSPNQPCRRSTSFTPFAYRHSITLSFGTSNRGSYSTGVSWSAPFAAWQRSRVWAPQSSSFAPESKSWNPRQPPSTYF